MEVKVMEEKFTLLVWVSAVLQLASLIVGTIIIIVCFENINKTTLAVMSTIFISSFAGTFTQIKIMEKIEKRKRC